MNCGIEIKWRMSLAVMNAMWCNCVKFRTSTGFQPVTSRYWCWFIWTHNWPAPNISGFIAQLVRAYTPVSRGHEFKPRWSPEFFSGFFTQLHQIVFITARIILHLIINILILLIIIEFQLAILQLCVQWPGLWVEVRLELNLFWYRPRCFSRVNHVVMLTSLRLQEKDRGLYQNKVTPASLLFKGQVTQHTTVKWTIGSHDWSLTFPISWNSVSVTWWASALSLAMTFQGKWPSTPNWMV